MMISHRPSKEHARTMEAFIKFSFPSAPEKSFSSLVCDKLPILAAKIETEAFAIGFCGVLLSLWSQCLDEKFVRIPTSFIENAVFLKNSN
jgi:hypothetical protein